jgi:aromatic-L-amino-acid decarboxylase
VGLIGRGVASGRASHAPVFVTHHVARDSHEPSSGVVRPDPTKFAGDDKERLLRKVVGGDAVHPSRKEREQSWPKGGQEDVELRLSPGLCHAKQSGRPLRHEPPFGRPVFRYSPTFHEQMLTPGRQPTVSRWGRAGRGSREARHPTLLVSRHRCVEPPKSGAPRPAQVIWGTLMTTPAFPLGDMTPAEFADAGHALVDWIARYLTEVEHYPVLSRNAPGEVREALTSAPPELGTGFASLFADFERAVLPGITHWNHPAFFAYFSITGSTPGILAEFLTAALNVNGMLWRTSPAATELEQVTLDWLRQLLGLEDRWFGIITDTASTSTLLALAAARESRPELDVRRRGLAGRPDLPTLRIYTSEQSHSSVDKAAITLGFGHENVVHVPVDADWRMQPDALARAVADDRARQLLPLAVVATVGTTGTSSIDPVPAIADICGREGLWLHVDGAYGGMAAVVPELRSTLDGVARADSFVVNPHKWLFTPIDCSVLYTRRPDVLRRAFALVPEYLVTSAPETVVNYMDYGFQLGHRFRALKLWAVIRIFGAAGLAERVRHHCALAREFASWVDANPEWQRAAPVPFSLVCFRFAPRGVPPEVADERTAAILEYVNNSGRAYLSHTKLAGRYVLRLAIGNLRTEHRHLVDTWQLLQEAATAVTERSLGAPATSTSA